jgi:hypothetical protein
MRDINFWSPKGGQGTTTLVCGIAKSLSRYGEVVQVVGEGERANDALACFGSATLAESNFQTTINDNLQVSQIPAGKVDRRIFDCGTDVTAIQPDCLNVMVTKACYLSLRRLLKITRAPEHPDVLDNFDGFVLVEEPGRALNVTDVESVTGMDHLGTVHYDSSIARTVDAGLLAVREPHRDFRRLANSLADLADRKRCGNGV